MKQIETLIKILLAILFFLCLLDMPYGYYQLVRFIALVGFSILAYRSYEKEYKNEMIIFIGLALLFQPFIKIALGRELWNITDVIVGIGLLITLFIKRK
jgi:general stress protein CsbA